MFRLLALAMIMAFFSPTVSISQQSDSPVTSTTVEATVSTSSVTLLGRTKEVRNIDTEVLYRSNKHLFKKNRKRPENFIGRRGESNAVLLDREHQGPDALRQTSVESSGFIVEPELNIDGLFSSFGSPHDPTGDVGVDYYIQAINASDVRVINKMDGSTVSSFSMQSLWAEFGVSSEGDPIVLYDERENRWFLTEFTNPANMLIAVSETSDPLGAYHAYNFSTPEFPDYPKFGIWPNALVATTNEGGAGTLHNYFIDKAALLSGAATAAMQRVEVMGNTQTEAGFFVSTPVDIDGDLDPSDTRPIVVTLDDSSWGSAPEDRINIFRFDVDFGNASNTTVEEVNIPTSPFDGFPCSVGGAGFACIPQLNGGGLDGVPEVIMNVPKLRRFGVHESLVMSFVTDVTDGENLSGIRWVEMRRPVDGGEWSLYQEGTYSPDGLDRFMSSIAMDAAGNIGLAYNVSSPDIYAGIRYTGRLASDPLGEMTVAEYTVVEGQNTIQSFGRFGDYAQMSVDPVDGSTFWYTSEYAGGGSSRTRIVSFKMQQADFDLAATEIQQPSTSSSLSATENVSILVTNLGQNDMTDYTIGYSLDGVFIEEVVVSTTIVPGGTYLQEFSTPLDLSAIGSYTIDAYVSHPNDMSDFNNEATKVVEHLLSRDASLSDFVAATSICAESAPSTVTLTNLGFDVLTSLQYDVTVNGALQSSDTWTGALDNGQSTTVALNVDLTMGENTIVVTVTSVNSDTDQNPDNDSVTGEIEQVEGAFFNFSITFDDFPQETSWSIIDSEGAVVAAGGSFTVAGETIETEICLNSEECYTFEILDSYGDGICCTYSEGSYTMLSGGQEVFSGGEFGDSMTHEFCGDGQVSSVGDILLDPSSLSVYPNPNDGYFQLSLSAPEISDPAIRLSVFDISGKEIQSRLIARYDQLFVTTVSLVDYPAGNYFVKLSDGKYSVTKQVIRE